MQKKSKNNKIRNKDNKNSIMESNVFMESSSVTYKDLLLIRFHDSTAEI